jgi:hypothetical protein
VAKALGVIDGGEEGRGGDGTDAGDGAQARHTRVLDGEWGSVCHHVKREASRFILSTLSLHAIGGGVFHPNPGWQCKDCPFQSRCWVWRYARLTSERVRSCRATARARARIGGGFG